MRIPFDVSELSVSLDDHFARGFTEMTLIRSNGLLVAAALWHPERDVLTIQSLIFDKAERKWLEMGYLKFSETLRKDEASLARINLETDFQASFQVFKLIASEVDDDARQIQTESGLEIMSSFGNSLVIVSGGQPFTLAVYAKDMQEQFVSEYRLTEYSKMPLWPIK